MFFYNIKIAALSMSNFETKCGGQVFASIMVVENGAIASTIDFLLAAWMGPDYSGTAPLQNDLRVVPCWRRYKKKGCCREDGWV